MKTKLLLASLAMATFAGSAWAELPEDGEYLIQNVETGYYLGGSNYWGTQACLINKPQWFALTSMSDGVYSLDSHQYNGATSHFLSSGLYVDSGETGWTFAENGENITISLDGAYLAGDGKNSAVTTVADGTAAAAQWRLITKEEIVASQESATAENPVDVTAFIRDPELKRNASTSYFPTWTITGADGTGSPSNFSQGQSGNVASCAESYHSTNGFMASQSITGLKAGYYRLDAQAFYREDGTETALPYVFANDEKATFPLLTGTENSMVEAYASFLAEKYPTDPIYVKLAEGDTLTIGFRGEATDKWNIFGELSLSYYGAESLIEGLYKTAVADARAIVDESPKMNQDALAALVAAIETYGNLAGESDDVLSAATDSLNAVLTSAQRSIRAYAQAGEVLEARAELIAKTNVYTEAALNTYYTEPKAGYDNMTLTDEEAFDLQSPSASTGKTGQVASFLLSVWDTVLEGTYYINTWSTEGNSDGSEFRVPFYEYWTGDASSLGAKTLTATLEGLTPNAQYAVSAWVRVRLKNNVTDDPTGITFQVGEGEAVNVSAGAQVGTSQMYLGEYAAEGTADENGTLTAKFIVAEDNNISWLAFKNVMYAEVLATGIESVSSEKAPASLSIYDLNGRKLNGLKKGINIVNGAKVLVK